MGGTKKPEETWAGAVKAIGIRALSSGKFWQFCFLCVLLALIYRIQSPDWVKIVDLFLSSPLYAGLGWLLWVITIFVAVVIHRFQRRILHDEIDRLSTDRNELQQRLIGSNTELKNSNYKPK